MLKPEATVLKTGVTEICRLSWLTNSALVNEPKCGVGSCEASANEYSCALGAQTSFGDLTPYLTYAWYPYIKRDITRFLNQSVGIPRRSIIFWASYLFWQKPVLTSHHLWPAVHYHRLRSRPTETCNLWCIFFDDFKISQWLDHPEELLPPPRSVCWYVPCVNPGSIAPRDIMEIWDSYFTRVIDKFVLK